MSSWATYIGQKKYQVTFSINVGYTVWGDSEEDVKKAMEGTCFDSRSHFFIEIEQNGVDWIAPNVEEVKEKDE